MPVGSVSAGGVYLVGAGPGSPDLITVRGLRILRSADVVLTDALIAPELLAEARADAQVIHVGKRGYCVGSTRQETINEALVRYAREGHSVCRLKCGDPCVFGRGGEEAEVLAEAGVPFEIVPGVTSAVGACAAVGIPLTHRATGQAVALVTGHHDPDSPDCMLDWDALSRIPTLVFYMAVRHVAKIAARLTDNGLSPDTPAAVIESATLPSERIFVVDLHEIGAITDGAAIQGPAVFVVGEVVRYRERLTQAIPTWVGAFSPLSPAGRGAGGEGLAILQWKGASSLRQPFPLTPNPSPQRGEGNKREGATA